MTAADVPAAGLADPAERSSSLATLAFLLSPEAHPPGRGPIESIETHMSWLVLDAQQVLKLKKPVCYPPLLNYRSLAAREGDARAEVRLNRRLAPEVYQGLLLVRREGGRLVLRPEAALLAAGGSGDSGETVDWLVQMQRLPADQRAVLLLVAMEDMSYEDTARILSIPVGTVMSRLSRARMRLRVLMDREPTSGTAPAVPAAQAGAAAAAGTTPALRRLK